MTHPAIKYIGNKRERCHGVTTWVMYRTVAHCDRVCAVSYVRDEPRGQVAARILDARLIMRGQVRQQLAALDARRGGGLW